MDELPRLLRNFTPAPGLIKADYTDFIVEEIPLYPADGTGTHVYFLLEKSGLSTMQAVQDLARALDVRRHEIGFAGLKDARAVTRQWMSLEHADPERLRSLDLPRLCIRETTRHRNKLRLGHLKGNAFTIKVRETPTERLAELQDAVATLARVGVPNYFGPQRFGYRGDTWEIGRAILRGDIDEAIGLILGRPSPRDSGNTRLARELFEKGQYAEAARAWPRMFHTERRASKAMIRSGGKRRRALGAIDASTRTFYVCAYQSHLFNRVLVRRLAHWGEQTAPTPPTLWEGDLAWLHPSGAVFRVEDPEVEQPRADRFEISPTGPLFGYRMSCPTGRAGEMEASALAEEGLPADAFRNARLRIKGSRRPIRFQPGDARLTLGADARGPYLELHFTLPGGCYATAFLRELFALAPGVGVQKGQEEPEAATEVDG